MAKKRRKPKNRPRGATHPGSGGPATATRTREAARPAERPRSERAERKELARQERERARRQVARARRLRRLATVAVIGGAVAVGAFLLLRVGAPGAVSAEAQQIGEAAGCTDLQTPAGSAPGGQHLAPGETTNYSEHPATSGIHAPSALPGDPAVSTVPLVEEGAVHNLEHGYVILYYRAEGEDALPQEVVDRLATIAEREDKVMLAPHPQLDEGISFAMTAWNKLWECPGTVTASDAAAMADSFVEAYRGTSNAPEANAA